MFGFSRRRMKLGRLKVHLGDPLHGTRSPIRPNKRHSQQSNRENVGSASAPTNSGNPDDLGCERSSGFDSALGNSENWMVVSTSGESPTPRFNHAATVVGSRMVVVGGDSGRALLDDTQVLNLDKLTWAAAVPKVYLSPTSLPLKIPTCKGHAMVSWGTKVLMIGGKTDPGGDKVSVWSFDTETECWSHIEAKGDIPVARSGHAVIRAGPVLILFGGEDAKGRKLNDLHMFDLKSMMWLPLHYTGAGPSPRSNHAATLYDDRILLVFGGQSKSRILNDLYSLDFETMVWSRIKLRGHHPSPRAGCCGVLCGTKWYIAGGGSKKKRYAETLVFDVIKLEMSVAVTSPLTSITTSKGFSLVPVHHKDKVFLVAFGGSKKEPSNQVEILIIVKDEHSISWQSGQDNDSLLLKKRTTGRVGLAVHLKNDGPADSIAKHSVASIIDHHSSGRRSLSETSIDPKSITSNVSLRKQFHHVEEYNSVHKQQKAHEDDKHTDGGDCAQGVTNQESAVKPDIAGRTGTEVTVLTSDSENSNDHQKQGNGHSLDGEDVSPAEIEGISMLSSTSNFCVLYETKIAALMRKNILLEGQLASALSSRETAEKNLSSAIKSNQDIENKLVDAVKEVELLKEKLANMELVQEDANSLSNIVHSDNVRLEHDVAFLKAVLDDTQKELQSTRGVLAAERARAFQLQVEVFHLKQRLQSLDSRAPTPRKPFHM
uniref:Acyl-CoA-binding domain-containing protein 4 n=1 Tax=Anthurium amnicola TaxID=1678845 RepID=A0A1D1XQR5_9ARAE